MVRIDTKRKIIVISLAVSTVLLLLTALLVQDTGTLINVGIICMFIIITPFFLYQYTHLLWIKSVEREFPNFVRDLGGLKKSGITLIEAIRLSTKNNYGKLTPEIKTLSNKLSWGVPFSRAMELFKKRFEGSKIIPEAISIIEETYKTGGDISAILFSLSKDMLMLLDAEDERKSIAQQHVLMMYGIFFLFVGISMAIISIMVPMISSQKTELPGGSTALGLSFSFYNPCETTYAPFPCEYFNVVSEAFNVKSGIGSYYFSLFFTVLLIEAVFMGLISGEIGEGSLTAGIKHSLIMLISIFLIFNFTIRMGMLPL